MEHGLNDDPTQSVVQLEGCPATPDDLTSAKPLLCAKQWEEKGDLAKARDLYLLASHSGDPEEARHGRQETMRICVDLAKRCGDVDSFRVIVEYHQTKLVRLCSHIIGATCIEDIHDLVQETFIRAWEKMDTLRDSRQVSAWLMRIAARLAYDFIRRKSRERVFRSQFRVDPSPPRSEGLSREYVELLEVLPNRDDRVILHLHLVEGLTYREIAVVLDLGIGEDAVRVRAAKALRSMREFLE